MGASDRLLVCLLIQMLATTARDLRLVTVATAETDGYQRFLRSAQIAGLEVSTLGMGQEWQGGDMMSACGFHIR